MSDPAYEYTMTDSLQRRSSFCAWLILTLYLWKNSCVSSEVTIPVILFKDDHGDNYKLQAIVHDFTVGGLIVF